jgi:hypothetical protein
LLPHCKSILGIVPVHVLYKTKDGSGLSKVGRSVDNPDIRWESGNESRRCFGENMGCYSLFVFRRSTSSGPTLLDVGGLMAFLGMRLVACFLLSRPLSMAARRLRGLFIGIIFNLFIITLSPLLLLLLYLFFTSLSIGGRRITPSWLCATLRGLLSQCLLHDPQRSGVMPSLGPPLIGGLFRLMPYLHPHDLGEERRKSFKSSNVM